MFLEYGQQEIGWLGLGANHATEAIAEATIRATSARNAVGIRVGSADVGRRRGIRMIAEGLRGVAEEGRKIRDLGWRRGIFFATPALKDVSAIDELSPEIARLAGTPKKSVNAGVVRFEFVIGNSPIADSMVSGQSLRAILRDGFGK